MKMMERMVVKDENYAIFDDTQVFIVTNKKGKFLLNITVIDDGELTHAIAVDDCTMATAYIACYSNKLRIDKLIIETIQKFVARAIAEWVDSTGLPLAPELEKLKKCIGVKFDKITTIEMFSAGWGIKIKQIL